MTDTQPVVQIDGERVAMDETLSHRDAAERLTELGYDAATARAMVADYLDDASREIGVPVHQWGLDQHDVDAIAACHADGCPITRRAHGVPLDEQERRAQLAAWHADDQAAGAAFDDGTTDTNGGSW